MVVIVVFDGVQMLDVVGPAEVFSAATRNLDVHGYRLQIVSQDGTAVRSDSGLRLEVDAALLDVEGLVDTLIVAGGMGAAIAAGSADLLAALQRIGPQSRRICSVCTGATVLASCGWLTGRSATTHWTASAQLAQHIPDVNVVPDRIFVRDGKVWTSGGVSAGMDLALALVEADHNADIARTVARELVLFLQRPGGQSQFSERFAHRVPPKSPLRSVVDAVVADPTADHRLAAMAGRANVSERHLTRLFTEHTQMTPAQFVERIRIESARDHLEQTSLDLSAVASRSGFGSSETLRRAFGRTFGVTPSEYRQRFQSTIPIGSV
ncbi:GlxA family transcriptional regulator [Mycolicibacterium goodii]|nr:GlxA family transcriptional regulator [Mycolicibacterium goodii]